LDGSPGAAFAGYYPGYAASVFLVILVILNFRHRFCGISQVPVIKTDKLLKCIGKFQQRVLLAGLDW